MLTNNSENCDNVVSVSAAPPPSMNAAIAMAKMMAATTKPRKLQQKHHNHQQPSQTLSMSNGGLELGELDNNNDDTSYTSSLSSPPLPASSSSSSSSPSSSSSTSPNGKYAAVAAAAVVEKNIIIPAGHDPHTGQQYGLDSNYLLKQMNKRKLHLPCPQCHSLVVNMSDHLAKTHTMMDFKERKNNLNIVRNTYIMNPAGLKKLIEYNPFLIGEIKVVNNEENTVGATALKKLIPKHADGTTKKNGLVKQQQHQPPQQPPQPLSSPSLSSASQSLAYLDMMDPNAKMQELLKLVTSNPAMMAQLKTAAAAAAVAAAAAALTPDQSDVDRYSEESETNNTKPDSSPDSTVTLPAMNRIATATAMAATAAAATTIASASNMLDQEAEDEDEYENENETETAAIMSSSCNNVSSSSNASTIMSSTSYLNRVKQLKNKRKVSRHSPYSMNGGSSSNNKENSSHYVSTPHNQHQPAGSSSAGISVNKHELQSSPMMALSNNSALANLSPMSSSSSSSSSNNNNIARLVDDLESRLSHTVKSFTIFQNGVFKQIEQFRKDFQLVADQIQKLKIAAASSAVHPSSFKH